MQTLAINMPALPARIQGDRHALDFLFSNATFNRPAITNLIESHLRQHGTRNLYEVVERIRHPRRNDARLSNYTQVLTACSMDVCGGRSVDPVTTRSFQRVWMNQIWQAICVAQDNIMTALRQENLALISDNENLREQLFEIATNPNQAERDRLMEELAQQLLG